MDGVDSIGFWEELRCGGVCLQGEWVVRGMLRWSHQAQHQATALCELYLEEDLGEGKGRGAPSAM